MAIDQKIGIVYSETSANAYFNKMSYSQLFMAAQHQATMAGVRYDVLTETDLTDVNKLAGYDALLFPSFANVQASQVDAIANSLTTAVQTYHVGLIAAGEFMTLDPAGNALSGDSYARMKTLFNVQPVGGGFPADFSIFAGDVTHPLMNDYAAHELIRSYDDAGWLAFTPVDAAGTSVLATQTIAGQTYNAALATTTGGRNVHFSTEEVAADNNLFWQAIDYVVNGSGVTAGLQLSRNTTIVAARTDFDQAMERIDVSPEDGGPGIYDKLVPIYQQWKNAYNFVGSIYIDIGNNVSNDQFTDWTVSGPYYRQLVALGNEIGSHSITHPDDTNALSAAQIQNEFGGSKTIIEQQMSQILGRPYSVEGAALPGNPEGLSTALAISQYYDYISGGYSSVGAGFPGAIGYLTPAMASQSKLYFAPDMFFDFSLVEANGLTPQQALAEWKAEYNDLTRHSDVPVVVWPFHDYGSAAWPTNPPAGSPYATQMYTDFIAYAFNAGAEFVTLADVAQRITSFRASAVTTSVSGNTVTATITSADAGRFALDLDHLGSLKIASVASWYAYDDDSVFMDRNGGTFTITLGAAPVDVTHIVSLPMRAELVSLTGNGTNLSFSVVGDGRLVVDLKSAATIHYDVTGASVVSLVGDRLELALTGAGLHNVTIAQGVPNQPPVITSNGGGASAAVSVAENTVGVTSVVASDVNAGQTLTYAIAGGVDAALFAINASTGALTFRSAPDFEAPADQGRNNVYDVIVSARDNLGASDTQAIAVTVTNVAGRTANGTAADDTLTGGGEDDTLSGLGGSDTLMGLAANDTLQGGDGNDFLEGGARADRLNGGPGSDYATYLYAPAAVTANLAQPAANTGEAAGDSYLSIEGILGSRFDDVLLGDDASNDLAGLDGNDQISGLAGADVLQGGNGNDFLGGGLGGDRLLGGAGFDYARYAFADARVTVDLASPAANAGEAAGDTFDSIEGLLGSRFNDLLLGDANANDLAGFDGNDIIYGRGGSDGLQGNNGDDRLDGGAGTDKLYGGAGNDVFVLRRGEANGDMLMDFSGNGAAAGDSLQLIGYGTAAAGARIVQVDATHWRIDSAGGAVHDLITLVNGAPIASTDYTFV